MSKTMSSNVSIKPKLVEDFCEMDDTDLMFLFKLDTVNTLLANETVVIPSKNPFLQPIGKNSVQVPIEANG